MKNNQFTKGDRIYHRIYGWGSVVEDKVMNKINHQVLCSMDNPVDFDGISVDDQHLWYCDENNITEHFTQEDLSDSSTNDLVNHPIHYTKGKIEVIDFIEDQKLGYKEGNVVKYVCRARYKGKLQDLKKAQWYLNRLIEEQERTTDEVGS